MSNWIYTIKVLLVSTGVVALAIGMKLTVPVLVNFAVYELPALWSVVATLFKPPYLYVVINGIIITIVATTHFSQNHSPSSSSDQFHPLMSTKTPLPVELSDALALSAPVLDEVEEFPEAAVVDVVAYEVEKPAVVVEDDQEEEKVIENVEEMVVSRSTHNPPQMITPEMVRVPATVTERPLALSRFGPRKQLKSSPEGGKSLGVTRPRKHETLESTWKTITEGRHVPLTRHLKKNETWENHGHGHHMNVATIDKYSSPEISPVKKSETFQDRTNHLRERDLPMTVEKIRKEPSLSQDDLNRRVEAFIKNFNEEMRLQREQSLQQFNEMINRGAY